jgi:hypothetical protein
MHENMNIKPTTYLYVMSSSNCLSILLRLPVFYTLLFNLLQKFVFQSEIL